MVKDILFIGSSYLIIALVVAILNYFVLRINILGNFLMVLALSLIGSILGALANIFLHDYIHLLANLNGGKVNIFPSIFFSFLIVYIFSNMTQSSKRD